MSSSSLVLSSVAFPVAGLFSIGASYVMVSRIERLAGRFGLSESILGLLVALAADAPEITSSVTASSHGQQGIGIGVVVGSNVFNLAALLGLGALVARRIHLHRRVVLFEGATAIWIAAATVLVVAAGWPAAVGLLLVLAGVVPYVLVLAADTSMLSRFGLPQQAAQWLSEAVTEEEEELAPGIHPLPAGRRDATVLGASLVLVVAASAVMERTGETVGHHFHLSALVIGGIVLAAVTSLPNAVGAVFLASRGRGSAVLSEAMNSNMINVVAGLFVPGLFLGLGRASGQGNLVTIWCLSLTAVSLSVAAARRGLSRWDGLGVIAGYAAFVAAAIAY